MTLNKLLLATCACGIMAGCTSTQSKTFMTSFQSGDYGMASQQVGELNKSQSNTQDRLLWALQDLTAKYWAGDYRGCIDTAQKAETIVADYEARASASVRNIGSKLGSLVLNDSVKAYQGYPSDKILLNTYKGLSYLMLGDIEGAKVELRRAAQRRKEALETYAKAIEAADKEAASKKVDSNSALNSAQFQNAVEQHYGEIDHLPVYNDFANPFQVFMEGLLDGVKPQDDADRQNAQKLFLTLQGMVENTTAKNYADWSSQQSSGRRVHIVYESGMAPTKMSADINVPLFITGRLTMIHLAFPYFTLNSSGDSNLKITMGSQQANTEMLANVDSIQGRELKLNLKTIIMSQLVSATMKAVAENQIAKQNVYLGLAASLINTVTTGADTRSWSTLPKLYSFAMIPVEGEQLTLSNAYTTTIITLPKGQGDVFVHVRAAGYKLKAYSSSL